jgi:hypothetical protein
VLRNNAPTAILLLALAVPRAAHAQAEELPDADAEAAPAPAGPAPAEAPVPPPAAAAPPAPPAATAPAPAAAPTTALPDRRLVFIPALGLNLPVGTLAESYSAGFHAGALAGWRLTRRLSLNGEVALDLMDADHDASILRPHEHYFDVLLSPLVHFRSGDVVVGPKLGWFVNRRTQYAGTVRECMFLTGTRSGCGSDAPTVVEHSGQGFLVGANAAGFVPVGGVHVGLWASGTFGRFVTATCSGSACASELGNVVLLSLALAALL